MICFYSSKCEGHGRQTNAKNNYSYWRILKWQGNLNGICGSQPGLREKKRFFSNKGIVAITGEI